MWPLCYVSPCLPLPALLWVPILAAPWKAASPKQVLYKKEVNRVLSFSLPLPFLPSSLLFWFFLVFFVHLQRQSFFLCLYSELIKHYWEFR